MSHEWLTPPSYEQNASRFERELENLAWQHAIPGTTEDRAFLSIEWHRLLTLEEIDEASDLAERTENIELLRLARSAGDYIDQASAQFVAFEVYLTASDKEFIDRLIPKIMSTVQSCGGTPGQHSLEYQPLEEGEYTSGCWFSEGIHIFES